MNDLDYLDTRLGARLTDFTDWHIYGLQGYLAGPSSPWVCRAFAASV